MNGVVPTRIPCAHSPTLSISTRSHARGWWLLPAAGWRRVVAVGPSLVAVFVLLIGPAGVGILVLPLASWLFVRARSKAAYLVLIPVLLVGLGLRLVFHEYSGMIPALLIEGTAVIAAAWFARGISGIRPTFSKTPHSPNKMEPAGRNARP